MSDAFLAHLTATLGQIEADGLYKREREIVSPQAGHIRIAQNGGSRDVLNLCANNYLGLADDPRLVAAAKRSLDEDGFGMASVRFICGTRAGHRDLERALARVSRQGRRDPVCRLFRRQWRVVRAAARTRGRHRLRRAQPRLDHRRHPVVQGEALPLRQFNDMTELEAAAQGGPRRWTRAMS